MREGLHERCTKCGFKYRMPIRAKLCAYCDPTRRMEDERKAREEERGRQIESDIAEGRRDAWSGRITPRFED